MRFNRIFKLTYILFFGKEQFKVSTCFPIIDKMNKSVVRVNRGKSRSSINTFFFFVQFEKSVVKHLRNDVSRILPETN